MRTVRRQKATTTSTRESRQAIIDKILRTANREATRELKLIDDDPRELWTLGGIEHAAQQVGAHLHYLADGRIILSVATIEFAPDRKLVGAFTRANLSRMPMQAGLAPDTESKRLTGNKSRRKRKYDIQGKPRS